MHGGCLAQHFRGGRHALFGHFFALAFFHGTANQLNGLGQIKGFGQVFKRPTLKSRNGAVQVRKGRHDDDGQTRQFLFDLFQQIQARATGHADVTHQHLGAHVITAVIERGQHLLRVDETAGGQALAQQCFFKNETDGLIVIHDPDGFHAFGSFVLVVDSIPAAFGARRPQQAPRTVTESARLQGRGIKILKSVRPGTLSHSIRPWCCWTKVCANVNPNPDPPSRPETRG